ncbi:LytS/YhcK type 5TM receptor domain-containing protein [Anaeroarcus burkinensis]|uniref:LytS/YhcK type 5TM receptor domain-containing protein n=1 Tax=Anaeroarcus burkinensis TaxID=82376 RepID=UPI000415B2C5|nr:LytS/YhcK type 5TM receptor domain-containing protein [Anaeroarcus burkinensis]
MDVSIESIKNVGLIVLLAYPLTHYAVLQRSLVMISNSLDKVNLIVIFSMLSIVTNIAGTEVFNGALLSSRIICPAIAGLISGPVVGTIVGAIGGFHRYTLGGFTALPDFLSMIASGLIGGFFYKHYREKRISFGKAFFLGAIAGTLELLLVVLWAKPSVLALALVSWLGPANVIINAIGGGLFVSILKKVQHSQYSIGASYAEIATVIAQKTLPVVKGELDLKSAQKVASILLAEAGFGAVAINDGKKVLAFCGAGDEHHKEGDVVLPQMAMLAKHEIGIANSHEEIGCAYKACPLDSAIVVALNCGDERVGNLEVYKVRDVIHPPDVKLVTGIAELISSQIYIARLRQKEQMLSKAEYDTLRSQINPHFLFNTLSVIKFLVRTEPEKAQHLILTLASFLRKNLKTTEDLIPFAEEMKYIEFYLTIQQARFGERLDVEKVIESKGLDIAFPAFTLQPLVENSLNHGLASVDGALKVVVTAQIIANRMIVRVEDNGVGIPEEVIEAVRSNKVLGSMGVGLTNVNRRLKSIFGREYSFTIQNKHPGAMVEIQIPIATKKGGQ